MGDLGFFDLIIGFLLLITPVVFFHELGHYWVARKAGVIVEVFSIGFGPELYGWTAKNGTRWRFAAIPFGGYVKMRGDEDAASTPGQTGGHVKGSFGGAGLYWRMAIVLAGPVANFILGILLFAVVYITVGKQVLPAVIGDVIPDMPAAEAGLQSGDLILEIDGIKIREFNDMRGLIIESPGKQLDFRLRRDGQELSLPVTPKAQFSEQLDITVGVLGVKSVPVNARVRMAPSTAVVAATSDAFHMSIMILRGLGRAVTGNIQKGEVGGPVRIAEISGTVLNQGIVPFILLTALISINLGLINLLPIPALDGGHLAFFLIEALLGKPLPLHWQAILMRGGIAILMTLTLFLVLFDLARLIP
jgi:regulator of sigma E protease